MFSYYYYEYEPCHLLMYIWFEPVGENRILGFDHIRCGGMFLYGSEPFWISKDTY